MTPSPNTTLAHYKIVSKIGAGGMGEVYLAQDTILNRRVALKILPSEFADNKDRMSRFIREAQSASALNHPNIITIYEIGESEGAHFIATEFIQGETLHKRLQHQLPNLKTTLDTAIQITSALDAAHRAGIVHRDIKPDNVMIRPDGLVKILDFGIAKLSETRPVGVDEEAATALKQDSTSSGTIVGTANYMSPEQARGKEIDARSDIFSFGLVFYELLTGKRAFAGENALDVIGAILHKEPIPPNQIRHDLPSEVERIVNKTLRKDADDRYQTARDLLTDLKDVRRELDFQDKLDRTVAPESHDIRTQVTSAASTSAPATSSAEFIVRGIQTHKLSVALVSLVLLALLGSGLWFIFLRRPTSNGPIQSIAVLPFENRSGNADSEYLSDGLSESLIYRLSQLPDLKVSPTSAVMRYKGKALDAQKVAADLGVQAVMSGRMIQRGENLSISVELIDVANNKLIWGEQYERKMSDLLATQREIATVITEKLQLKLSGETSKGITKKYTESNEAYQLYLKGRFVWNKRTGDSLKQAVAFYNQAIEKDPGFALAYSGLAESYVLFSNYDVASPRDSMSQAKATALRALELDESLAEAHAALAWYLVQFEYDNVGAEREFKRAIELNPRYGTAHQWYAQLLAQIKRFDEAQVEVQRAVEADPLSPVISFNVGWHLILARRYDEALKEAERAVTLHPDFNLAKAGVCWAAYNKGDLNLAIPACRKARELVPDGFNTGYLAFVLGRAGQMDEARKMLEELKRDSSKRTVPSVAFAFAHLGLNQKEEALAWLEREVDEHGYWATGFAVQPEFDEFHTNPRFKALLRKMNLPE